MFAAAMKSIEQMLSPPFRMVLVKAVGLTLGLFVAVGFVIQAILSAMTISDYPYVDTVIAVLAGLGVILGLVFLIGPVTCLFAGLFLGQVAVRVVIQRLHVQGELLHVAVQHGVVHEHHVDIFEGRMKIEILVALGAQERIAAIELFDRCRAVEAQEVARAPGVLRFENAHLVSTNHQIRRDTAQKVGIAVVPIGDERLVEQRDPHLKRTPAPARPRAHASPPPEARPRRTGPTTIAPPR